MTATGPVPARAPQRLRPRRPPRLWMAAPARGATTPRANDSAPGLLSGLARLPGQVIVQRQGTADVVALRLVALQPAQVLQDVGAFHAFGHHAQPQVVRQVDGGAHDHGVTLGALHAHDEGLVDLELLYR